MLKIITLFSLLLFSVFDNTYKKNFLIYYIEESESYLTNIKINIYFVYIRISSLKKYIDLFR